MTDYKQLCAELLAAWEIELGELAATNRLAKRARAALAEPEPEEPTDEELRKLWRLGWQSANPEEGAILFAREALARWGNHNTSRSSINV